MQNKPVDCHGGGKEVHACDVADAVELLLHADDMAGEVYSCCDRYVSELDVARIAQEVANSTAIINGEQRRPKNIIICDKIRSLGLQFGGEHLLRKTIQQLVDAVRAA